MDPDKIKNWMDFAQQMYGQDFWKNIMNQENMKDFMGDTQRQQPIHNHAASNPPPPFPAVDIIKTPSHYVLLIDLPGFQKEEIKIILNGDSLVLQGQSQTLQHTSTFIQKERFHGSFERQIKLPEPASKDHFSAKFINGILQITYSRLELEGEVVEIE
ncbi:Hsp20/alpha crystallin family protein [Falsibacillus albus]|nr:Hsp20/alpha crystallin family protein [Falsibacillus albus]